MNVPKGLTPLLRDYCPQMRRPLSDNAHWLYALLFTTPNIIIFITQQQFTYYAYKKINNTILVMEISHIHLKLGIEGVKMNMIYTVHRCVPML